MDFNFFVSSLEKQSVWKPSLKIGDRKLNYLQVNKSKLRLKRNKYIFLTFFDNTFFIDCMTKYVWIFNSTYIRDFTTFLSGIDNFDVDKQCQYITAIIDKDVVWLEGCG